jgi:hypothetical protein
MIPELLNSKQPPKIWSKSLLVCASICEGSKARKEIFGLCGGITSIIPFLYFEHPNQMEKEHVLICAIECVWGTICGNLKHEDIFFELEGIFILLDLLESSAFKAKSHIMGCVLDLLENPKCIYLALEWRTKEDVSKGLKSHLLSVWSREEKNVNCIYI